MTDNVESTGEEKKGVAGAGLVADYLAAPKKKQKTFIVLALGANFSSELESALGKYFKELGKALVVVRPETPEELARQVSRHIQLMILDDSFAPRDRLLKLVRFMKEKKTTIGLPVLFLTREPKEMTTAYRQILLAHQENDDYVDLKGMTPINLIARVKQALEYKNRRRSRRFKVALPISFQMLGSDAWHKGTLVDISLHGGMVATSDSTLSFDLQSQVRLQIPISDVLSPAEGEIFRLSGRVRRLSITGASAGMSFEHVTERQMSLLTEFVTNLAAAQSTERDVENSIAKSVE